MDLFNLRRPQQIVMKQIKLKPSVCGVQQFSFVCHSSSNVSDSGKRIAAGSRGRREEGGGWGPTLNPLPHPSSSLSGVRLFSTDAVDCTRTIDIHWLISVNVFDIWFVVMTRSVRRLNVPTSSTSSTFGKNNCVNFVLRFRAFYIYEFSLVCSCPWGYIASR